MDPFCPVFLLNTANYVCVFFKEHKTDAGIWWVIINNKYLHICFIRGHGINTNHLIMFKNKSVLIMKGENWHTHAESQEIISRCFMLPFKYCFSRVKCIMVPLQSRHCRRHHHLWLFSKSFTLRGVNRISPSNQNQKKHPKTFYSAQQLCAKI